MDLQTERRLEQLLRFLDLPCARIGERMEFAHAGTRLFVEVADGRLTLSLASAVDAARHRDALMRVIARCDPLRMQGLVLRAFAAGSQLVVSCAFPRDTSVDDWLAGHRTMRRLLDAHAGDAA